MDCFENGSFFFRPHYIALANVQTQKISYQLCKAKGKKVGSFSKQTRLRSTFQIPHCEGMPKN